MPSAASAASADALTAALRQVLEPLARLAVARGVTHATLDELLKQALVEAADHHHAALPPHRRVSRITTATGIHRREVSRLVALLRDEAAAAAPPQRSHASELFYHWRTNPAYGDLRGSPAELPRSGSAPSFESLAHAITRDVHPRSLLDELLRLGLAALDHERDSVRLVREAFVPQGDEARSLGALGRNVGAHLEAAVDNLLLDNRRHLEQAIFAEPLGEASMAEFRSLVRDQWQAILASMVPALEAMIERDAAAPDAATAPRQRLRLGLYALARPVAAAPSASPAGDPPPTPPNTTATP